MGGDYVMTPNMVEGKQPIHFAGNPHHVPSTEISGRGGEKLGQQGST